MQLPNVSDTSLAVHDGHLDVAKDDGNGGRIAVTGGIYRAPGGGGDDCECFFAVVCCDGVEAVLRDQFLK